MLILPQKIRKLAVVKLDGTPDKFVLNLIQRAKIRYFGIVYTTRRGGGGGGVGHRKLARASFQPPWLEFMTDPDRHDRRDGYFPILINRPSAQQ